MTALRQPVLADDAFLEDVARARGQRDALHLWWLGQSGFLVVWREYVLLLDPYLSDSLTRKYAETDKPHVRLTARVVAPECLSFVDVATSTHNHTDHLDAETLVPLKATNPDLALVIPEANRAFVADRLRCDPAWPVGLDAGESAEVGGIRFSAVPAAHEGLDRDAEGRHPYLGYVVTVGPWTLYHSGDTLWYEGLDERLRPFGIDVAFLPINGRAPERRVAGNLNGAEAAALGRAAGIDLVVPCHFDMFAFNTADPSLFVEEAKRLGQPHRVLENGERLSLSLP